MLFFHLRFLNVRGILAQNMYNACTIFCQFSNVKNGGQSPQPSIFGQLVTSDPERIGISCAKES